MISVALFGGSFNPFHHGHEFVCKKMLRLGFKKVFVMPAKLNPLKAQIATPPLPARIAACKFATKHIKNVEVVDFENLSPSFNTAMVLKAVNKRYASRYNFSFVMGADSLTTIHKWPFYEQILRYANLVIVNRGDNILQSLQYCKTPFFIKHKNQISFGNVKNNNIKLFGNGLISFVKCSSPNVSSTAIRGNAKLNLNCDNAKINHCSNAFTSA
jgi:nicotinate (nicotinamide) nucleotide adenylyltransferase